MLDASITLLSQNPGASLSDIAQAAGVGRATLYRHFESRDQLIQALIIDSLEATDAALESVRDRQQSAREALEQGMVAVMRIADRFHFLFVNWSWASEDPEVATIYQRQLEELSELVERGKRESAIATDLATDMVVGLIDSLVYAGWWTVHTGSLNTESAGEQAARMLFQGIAPKG